MARSETSTSRTKRTVTRTPSADVTDAIIDAAERLLVEHGADALTVRAIAAAADVAPMSVYNRLGGKTGVIEALFVRGFDGLRAAISDVGGDDPLEDLAEAGRRYRRFARTHASHYALMFERAVPDFEPSHDAAERAHATFRELEMLVQRAMAAGVLAPGDPADVAQGLWNNCHGAVSLELRGIGFTDDPEASAEASAYAVLRGLRPAD